MEKLLEEVRGHLGKLLHLVSPVFANVLCAVLYSTRFLEGEDIANNFLFNADRLVIPIPRDHIYD